MARRNPKREYREVDVGRSKSESNRLPPGWSPPDDYRTANAASRPLSGAGELQIAAVWSWCTCPACVARRNAA
ncbi:hypothetical protein [Kitasatospora sp. NPDC091276]|uniref:hypothetical protein n=1 Tax=Kitasatospora sp. NPDC091276 TaxID=3155300 RepID=UPI00344AD4CF